MTQDYEIDSYDKSRLFLTNIQYFENNFECLRTVFSGSSSPSDTVAGMPWFDFDKKILKIRNAADDGWMGVMYGTSATKIWNDDNVARDGWVIDSSITDCVLALKGGTSDYNVVGGTVSGTWQQDGCTLSGSQTPSHDHGTELNHTHKMKGSSGGSYAACTNISYAGHKGYYSILSSVDDHTHDSVGGDESHDHGDTYRPRAAVGTLQYVDV